MPFNKINIKHAIQSAAFASAIMLTACVTPEQQQAAYTQQLVNKCQGFGFAPGTPDFKQCMMSMYQQDQANNAAMQKAAMARQQPQPASNPFQPLQNIINTPYVPPTPVTTNCIQNGQTISCNSQ